MEFQDPGISATQFFRTSHRGSIGFKSGEEGGCSRFLIPNSCRMFFATVLQ